MDTAVGGNGVTDRDDQQTSDMPKVEETSTDQASKKMGEKSTSSSKKENAKNKPKPDKSLEQIFKTLHTLQSPEEKLAAVCKKYAELLEEHRTLQSLFKQSQMNCLHLQREKEQLQVDHSKAVLTRSRLESLCRELQKQNKLVQEESLVKVREEEEKRKEVSQKFQTTLGEIHNLMESNNQKNTKLRDENVELGQKLRSLVDQYELREKHVDEVIKHKELEAQLAEAKLAKVTMQLSEEKEIYLTEKKHLLQDLTDYQKKCHELASNEIQLRTQLNMYTEKYEEFQSTLNKSNEVFHSFKAEMDKMSKRIKKLENETSAWKNRWESSNQVIAQMEEDKKRRDQLYVNSQKRVVQLEKLCRALQTERVTLHQQLKLVANDKQLTDTADFCTSDLAGDQLNDEQSTTPNVPSENDLSTSSEPPAKTPGEPETTEPIVSVDEAKGKTEEQEAEKTIESG